jgi:hypothetical protein
MLSPRVAWPTVVREADLGAVSPGGTQGTVEFGLQPRAVVVGALGAGRRGGSPRGAVVAHRTDVGIRT